VKISFAGACTSTGEQRVEMATVIKKNNSPFWYMKFRIGGKQYLLSTKGNFLKMSLSWLLQPQTKPCSHF